jgi:signal peptidase I
MGTKRVSPWESALISFVLPGMGQIYNSELIKGIILLISVHLICAIALILLGHWFWGLVVFIALTLILRIGAAADAWIMGKKARDLPLKSYNRSSVYLLIFIAAIIIFYPGLQFIRDNCLESFRIPSGSSEPTLQIGDNIMVSKGHYRNNQPARGDLAVFVRPDDPATDFDESQFNIIKRLIGLPGETVEVRGTTVFINNEPLTEDYAEWRIGGVRDFSPQVVPDDSVFFLGDNRDYSKDSRFWNQPFIEISRLKGKALYIYWSRSFGRIGQEIK